LLPELTVATVEMKRAQQQFAPKCCLGKAAQNNHNSPFVFKSVSAAIHCDTVDCVYWQAGLRSELEIATDEMERAQHRLATLEREKDVLLQGTSSPTAAQAAMRSAPNKLVEESLRKELQNQVCIRVVSPS